MFTIKFTQSFYTYKRSTIASLALTDQPVRGNSEKQLGSNSLTQVNILLATSKSRCARYAVDGQQNNSTQTVSMCLLYG